MYWQVAMLVLLACEGDAKEEIDITHEVNDDIFVEFRHELLFKLGVRGKEDKVINVNADLTYSTW